MHGKSYMESILAYLLLYVFGVVSGFILLLVLDSQYVPWWEITNYIFPSRIQHWLLWGTGP